MSKPTPTPKEWPTDADNTETERMEFMNNTDFLELKNTNPAEFAGAFICIQPILLRFEGLTFAKSNLKFAIIGSNSTLTMINYYAPQIGKAYPAFSTFDIDAYLNHVYVTITQKMPEKDRKDALQKYDSYKDHPKDAILCVFRYKDVEKLIPLSKLVDEKIINKLTLTPANKEKIIEMRAMFTQKAAERKTENGKIYETSNTKENGKSSSETEKRKSPSKESTDVAETPKKRSKKKIEEDLKTINVDSAGPEYADNLAHAVIHGFAQIFNYPVKHTPIMAKVILDTARLLRDEKS